MRGEIIKQCSGDGGLSDASLVRADQDQCWFCHNRTLTDATRVSILKVISTQPTETWKDSSLFAARDGGVLVNYGADPTVRAKESLAVPHQVATMVHDRASSRNLRML